VVCPASRCRSWLQAWLLLARYSWRQLVLVASHCHLLQLRVGTQRQAADLQLTGSACLHHSRDVLGVTITAADSPAVQCTWSLLDPLAESILLPAVLFCLQALQLCLLIPMLSLAPPGSLKQQQRHQQQPLQPANVALQPPCWPLLPLTLTAAASQCSC
jgi:hypothetical protein